ncbi:MAG: hypothetical protein HYY10_02930 [Candidatus Liptonbacteria bacterium]|nr:hypothetical protein [Candidatus Liptonbacteria bacterium]
MIRGVFVSNPPNLPFVQLVVAWGQSVVTPYFLLDTGFSGDLKVSRKTAEELGLSPSGIEKVTIANGVAIPTPIAVGYVSMEGAKSPVTILISDGLQLVGIGLLTKFGYKATVDCKHRTVELEKV